MFIPPGFGSQSIMTTLGRMVYYTAQAEPWDAQSAASKETLVFLHGFGGGSSAFEWSKVYPAFAADYRILAPDLIGWGRSEHPVRDYHAEDYIAVITEFLEQTCSGPTTVIASNLTAAFTIRAAINRPELFKSLIGTTVSALSDLEQDYWSNGFAKFVRSINNSFVNQLFYSAGVANSLGVRGFLEQRQFADSSRISQDIVDAYIHSAQQDNAEYAALSFLRGDLSFDLAQYITQLTVPTAMIWGQGAEYTDPDISRRLAAMNPQAVRAFIQLDNVGLTPQLELPGVTIGLIRKLLLLLEQDVANPIGNAVSV